MSVGPQNLGPVALAVAFTTVTGWTNSMWSSFFFFGCLVDGDMVTDCGRFDFADAVRTNIS